MDILRVTDKTCSPQNIISRLKQTKTSDNCNIATPLLNGLHTKSKPKLTIPFLQYKLMELP